MVRLTRKILPVQPLAIMFSFARRFNRYTRHSSGSFFDLKLQYFWQLMARIRYACYLSNSNIFPLDNFNAPVGQALAHSPHNTHFEDFFVSVFTVAIIHGQAVVHALQPIQRLWSTAIQPSSCFGNCTNWADLHALRIFTLSAGISGIV